MTSATAGRKYNRLCRAFPPAGTDRSRSCEESAMHRLTLCSCLAVAAVFTSAARAVEPALGNIVPYGVQRGVETEVQFQGARLADAKEILFYSPGLTVSS